MSELEALLDAEAEHAEQHRDEPVKPGTKVSKPGHGRSRVFSVRLNPDEVSALQTLADESGLPPSTLVRSLIVEALRSPESLRTPRFQTFRMLARDELKRDVTDAVNAALIDLQDELGRREVTTAVNDLRELMERLQSSVEAAKRSDAEKGRAKGA